MRWTIIAVIGVSLAGCELLEAETPKTDAGELDECNEASGTASVAGRWKLTAQGSRTGCEREDLNVHFEIDAAEWLVEQSGTALSLSLDGDPFAPGTVTGSCVSFDTVEATSLGEVSIHWEGLVQGGEIVGALTVTGPEACRATGSFSVVLLGP